MREKSMDEENNFERIVPISFTLGLTGSKFFDTMIRMRAMELAKDYPGVEVKVEKDCLTIHGSLEESGAKRLHEELGIDSEIK